MTIFYRQEVDLNQYLLTSYYYINKSTNQVSQPFPRHPHSFPKTEANSGNMNVLYLLIISSMNIHFSSCKLSSILMQLLEIHKVMKDVLSSEIKFQRAWTKQQSSKQQVVRRSKQYSRSFNIQLLQKAQDSTLFRSHFHFLQPCLGFLSVTARYFWHQYFQYRSSHWECSIEKRCS